MIDFFDIFQLLTLLLYISIFVGRIIYLRRRKNTNPIVVGTQGKRIRRVLELLFTLGLVLWGIEVVLHSLHSSFSIFPSLLTHEIVDSGSVRILGSVLVVIGFIIFLWALLSFGTSWRVGIDEKNPAPLVTTGIFALSRNPIFLFFDLYFIGIFLINGTLGFLIFAVLIVADLHLQILQEEEFLSKVYGQRYEDYRSRIGRYIGRRRTSPNTANNAAG
jgi:protein-S-isoprenylcysteine O-methyltransferase Ste14